VVVMNSFMFQRAAVWETRLEKNVSGKVDISPDDGPVRSETHI
jgi:hypothetical protein